MFAMASVDPLIEILEPTTPLSSHLHEEPCYVKACWTDEHKPIYYCRLCHQPLFNWNDLQKHKGLAGHQWKEDQFKATLDRAISMLRNFDDSQQLGVLDRMEKLGLPAWKDAVRAPLFCHLMSDRQNGLLSKAEHTLVKYENWERLALLELAVWKAKCLKQMPNSDYSKAVDWIQSGWKTLKGESRSSNAIGTIITLIGPYVHT
jgi:hypothetical protein